ncbi:TetR/AcrR family transcriptional regulator [Nocardia sp. NPDC004123]
MTGSAKNRMTAAERSEQIIRVAVATFAESGYTATRTDVIARRANVSQPYVIRLFGSKQQLFLAALHHSFDRLENIVESAAARHDCSQPSQQSASALADVYRAVAGERDLLLVALHGFAATSEQPIRHELHQRYDRLRSLLAEVTQASPHDTRRFLAAGARLAIATALRTPTRRDPSARGRRR